MKAGCLPAFFFPFIQKAMQTLRIQICQTDLFWEQAQANRSGIEQLLRRQIEHPCDLIVLPEMFTTGFSMRSKELAETTGGPTSVWLSSLANEYNAAIAGSLIFFENGHYYNRLLVFTPGNDIPFHYDKKHLFSLAGENDHFSPGVEQKTFAFRDWKISFFICYDLRFPVWCRNTEGIDLMVFCANWPQKRAMAWNSLLPARAIENQCYVAGVNRIGLDGLGIPYVGDSAVFDFEGNRMAYADQGKQVAGASLDKQALFAFRRAYPFWKDRDEFQWIT